MSKNPPQIDKFIQAAKEHSCDEDEKAFAEKIRKITNAKKDNKKK